MKRKAFFATDLHGQVSRYKKLFRAIAKAPPAFVFLGGDLLPHRLKSTDGYEDFTLEYLIPELRKLRVSLGVDYPNFVLILGNDDFRSEEKKFTRASQEGLCHYLNNSHKVISGVPVFGYPFVPPTPFRIKDWEKYDIAEEVNPGCVSPSGGYRTIQPDYDMEKSTIARDLQILTAGHDLSDAVMLFHSPPYRCRLDWFRAEGKGYLGSTEKKHIGSIAIRHFIESQQPRVTLHGHIHESTRLSGHWRERFGSTISYNAAHDGPELCVIQFDIKQPDQAIRTIQ